MSTVNDNTKDYTDIIDQIMNSSSDNIADANYLTCIGIYNMCSTFLRKKYIDINAIRDYINTVENNSSHLKGYDMCYFQKRSNLSIIKSLLTELLLSDSLPDDEWKTYMQKLNNIVCISGYNLLTKMGDFSQKNTTEKNISNKEIKEYTSEVLQLTSENFVFFLKKIQCSNDRNEIDKLAEALNIIISNNDNNLGFFTTTASEIEKIKKEFVRVPIKTIFFKKFDYKYEVVNNIYKTILKKSEELKNDEDLQDELHYMKTQEQLNNMNEQRDRERKDLIRQHQLLEKMRNESNNRIHQIANPTAEEISAAISEVNNIPSPDSFKSHM